MKLVISPKIGEYTVTFKPETLGSQSKAQNTQIVA